MSAIRSDRGARQEWLRSLLSERQLDGIVLRLAANFAWYTGGADSLVDRSSPLGVADIVVTRGGEYVLCSEIEAPRMRDEQTPDMEVVSYPWTERGETDLRHLCGDAIGADAPRPGETDLRAEIEERRWVLDDAALELYRHLGVETRDAMSEAAASVRAGMTEWEIGALLEAACARREMHAPVLLVAADDRIVRYRHPLPTENRVRRRAMLVVCAERGGLYVSLTRFVELEEPDAETRARLAACDEILRRMREATQPGRSLAEILRDTTRFYAEAGFPDEWRLHHQGGLAGYASRELVATPSTEYRVRSNQAFAWNPSITGAKAEETFLLLETGAEVVT